MTTPAGLVEMFGNDPGNPDLLDEGLRPFVFDHPDLGKILQAPLVYQVPFFSWKMANGLYEQKKAALKEALAAGDYAKALWWFERPHRLPTLMTYVEEGRVSRSTLRELLPSLWMDTESPSQFGDIPLRLFRLACSKDGPLTDDAEGMPSGQITIYRGGDRDEKLGLAWTLDADRARWFATRYGRSGRVVTASVSASQIFGYFTGRNESEIVVDPARLTILDGHSSGHVRFQRSTSQPSAEAML